MIEEILPIQIWKTTINNFEAVQSEIANALESREWSYSLEDRLGRGQQYLTERPFAGDIIRDLELQLTGSEIARNINEYNTTLPKFGSLYDTFSWFTKYEERDFADTHRHLPNKMSGIYFYKIPVNDRSLYFLNSLDNTRYFPEVTEGTLILFPSHLEHGVYPNMSGEERITLAVNVG